MEGHKNVCVVRSLHGYSAVRNRLIPSCFVSRCTGEQLFQKYPYSYWNRLRHSMHDIWWAITRLLPSCLNRIPYPSVPVLVPSKRAGLSCHHRVNLTCGSIGAYLFVQIHFCRARGNRQYLTLQQYSAALESARQAMVNHDLLY